MANARMYSAGYHEGVRLRPYVKPLVDNQRHAGETDPYWLKLGVRDYAEGFRDGWWGEPPAVELEPLASYG